MDYFLILNYSLHSVVADIGHQIVPRWKYFPDGNLQSIILHQNAFTWVESLFLPLSILLPSEMPAYSPK